MLLQVGYAGYTEKCPKCGGNIRLQYWTTKGWQNPGEPEEDTHA